MANASGLIGKQVGSYRIVKELNSGSYGSVYQGKHLIFEDEPVVAIKVLHAHLSSPAERAQFITEAQLLKKLRHPYILPIIDAGIHDGVPFIVTEYAAGGSLHDRLEQQPQQPLPLEEVLSILAQVGQALQYAHQQHIVHRDLKPGNILFDAQGKALLADFGIAVVLATAGTKDLGRGGTPPYMAPEQFEGIVSMKSDQYALGCIAYELFTGQKSFSLPKDATWMAWGYKHTIEKPTPPAHINPHLPLHIEQAILTAMAKQRTDRYSDISAFIAALQKPQKTARQWVDEGKALYGLKCYEEALAAFEQALRLDPNDANAYNGKSSTLNELKRYEEALRLTPNNASHALNTAVPETQAPPVGATGSKAARSHVSQPEVVMPASPTAQSPGTVTPPPPPLVADGSLDKLHLPQRSISRRTVVLGLAGLATVAVAGGGIALLTTIAPAPTPAINSSGAMFGYDLAHTHFNPDEHILSPTNVSRLVLLWSAPTGDRIYSSPAVANGVVYVGSNDTKLYAFEAGTGKLLWSAATGDVIFSSPAVANGVVYVGSNDTKLYAFEAGTGKPLWSVPTGGLIYYSSPAVANGVVYVGSVDQKLYAFEAVTGKLLWSAATGDRIGSSPAVANGVVYVGSGDHKLYAFEAGTGKLLWSAATGDIIYSSPAVANGVVYVGSGDTKLYAFNATTGKLLWSAATGGPIFHSSPAVANGVVYVGSQDFKLYAFEAVTGKLLWSAATEDRIFSSPAVANGVVYVGSNDTKLYAFNATTGKPLWSVATGSFIGYSSPAVANGVVYVGSWDQKLYAFHVP